jgi:hypothetical protein
VTGATTLASSLGVTGNVGVTGTLGVTGATTLSNSLNVTGTTNINTSTSNSNATNINTGASGTGLVTIGNGTSGLKFGTSRLAINKSTAPASVAVSRTLSALEVMDMGILVVTSGGITVTFPAAASLAAVMPGGSASAGDIVTFTIVTTFSAGTMTVAAGSGGTIVGPTITSASRESGGGYTASPPRVVTIRFTSSSAYSLY